MKELLLFVPATKSEDALQELGALGVVQLEAIQSPTGESVDRCVERIKVAEQALALLTQHKGINEGRTSSEPYKSGDPARIIDVVLQAENYKQKCKEQITQLEQQWQWYQRWGENIKVGDIHDLRNKGVFVKLYQADRSEIARLPQQENVVMFTDRKGVIPVALFTKDPEEVLPLREDTIPRLSNSDVLKTLARKKRQYRETDVYLADMALNEEQLKAYLAYWKEQWRIRTALAGMGRVESKISYLRGFVPAEAADKVKTAAHKQGWGYLLQEPSPEREVPVYIRNPAWVNIINPVLQFVGVVPGYREVDISVFFLIAFALFFAMLIGDAGYGMLFLLSAVWFGSKLTPPLRVLIYVLGGATVAWGIITGTYFGSEQIAAIPALKTLAIEKISTFNTNNVPFMMHLSFLIGAIHLSVAHAIRGVLFINTLKALSELGWILLIWGLFFLVEELVLGIPMPEWSIGLFVAGLILAISFSMEDRNFLKSMGLSLANLPLSLINGFSDVVSYVRLFAVGMATGVVASSFNNMAFPADADPSPWQMIGAVLALFLGHGLNVILALMAVMVHGIRLNMLEFAGHLGIQFTGKPYQPFVLHHKNNVLADNKGREKN
ncbi:MAG: hypothetical protein R2795_23010 [Saprospiraceae bacterium]